MFQINEIVVYENSDLYKIGKIGPLDFAPSDREYYTLQSLDNQKNKIYVTTNNEGKIRPIISQATAESCLAQLPELDGHYNPNTKERDREYMDILKNGNCIRRLEMFKGILEEKARRSANGKQLCVSDDRYLQKVSRMIDYEFSIALNLPMQVLHAQIETAVS